MAKRTGDIELAGAIVTPAGGSQGVAGEDLSLTAGSGNATSGDGGSVVITAGAGFSTVAGQDGGSITLTPGAGSIFSGTQIVDVGGAHGGGDASGLTNDATVYTASIVVDGGSSQPIAITGSAAQTYTTLLSELNADTTGAVWSLSGGNLLAKSDSTGASSTIAITDTDLFLALSGFVAVNAAVAAGSAGSILLGGSVDGQGFAITDATFPLTINTQTGTSYTAVLTDADKMITLDNAAAIAMTIPANASVAYPIGTQLNFEQLGAGTVTIGITSDTLTLNSGATAVMGGQYSVATALKITSTSWVLFGQLVPAVDTVFINDANNNLYGGTSAGAVIGAGATGNTIAGQLAGNRLATGDSNVFLGIGAGRQIVTANLNIAIGASAMGSNSGTGTGTDNIAIGQAALDNSIMTTAAGNIGLGVSTLNGITSGDNNIAIGANAGDNISAGDNNVIIGSSAGPTGNQTDRLYINNASSDTPMIGGNFATGAVELSGTVRLTERADHIGAPAATFGEIWVRSDTPNNLIFTDDAGTDHNLTAPAGTPTGIADVDGDTSVNAETAADDDRIRFDTGSTDGGVLGGYPAATDTMILGSAAFTVTLPTANVAATAGAPINLNSGAGYTTGDGGSIGLTAGDGGAGGSTGGSVDLVAGDGGIVGGSVNLTAGGVTVDGIGGDIVLTAGAETGGNDSGLIILDVQSGGGTDGSISFRRDDTEFMNFAAGSGLITTPAGAGAGDAGGNIELTAGAGNAVSGDGGAVNLTAGAGGSTSGDGGGINLLGGLGTGDGNDGGSIAITGGAASATGLGETNEAQGGSVSILGGSNTYNDTYSSGGDIDITAGAGGGLGGDVIITAGDNPTTTGDSGFVHIIGGSGGDSSGEIELRGGDGTATATPGAVQIYGGRTSNGGAFDGAPVSIYGGGGYDGYTGGNVLITGGSGTLGTGAGEGGTATIRGGVAGAGVSGGSMYAEGGAGGSGGDGGGAYVKGGAAGVGAGYGGGAYVYGGDGGATGGGGGVGLYGGAGGATSGNAGDITLQAGAAAGSGSAGAIVIPNQTAPSVTTNKLYAIGGALTWNGTDLTTGSNTLADADGDTSVNVEVTADDDRIRFDTGSLNGGATGFPAATDVMVLGSGSLTVAMPTTTTATYSGAPISMTAGAGLTTGAGGAIAHTGGAGGATGTGGAVNLYGGAGGGTSGDGGPIALAAGAAEDGTGGAISLTAGEGGATLGDGGELMIYGGAGGAVSGDGGQITINAGSAATLGGGAELALAGGSGAGAGGAGGNVVVDGGTASDGNGGSVNLNCGNGTGTNRSGGYAYIYGGNSTGTAVGGAVALYGGTGGATATGGAVSLTGGDGGATSGDGGDANLIGGRGDNNAGDAGGNIVLWAGTGENADTNGTIEITTGDAGLIESVRGYKVIDSTGASALAATIPLLTSTTYVFEIFATARQNAGTESAVFRIFGGVEDSAGTAALVGSTAKDRTDDGGASVDWDVTVGIAAGGMTITLDNDAETVDWKIKVRMMGL